MRIIVLSMIILCGGFSSLSGQEKPPPPPPPPPVNIAPPPVFGDGPPVDEEPQMSIAELFAQGETSKMDLALRHIVLHFDTEEELELVIWDEDRGEIFVKKELPDRLNWCFGRDYSGLIIDLYPSFYFKLRRGEQVMDLRVHGIEAGRLEIGRVSFREGIFAVDAIGKKRIDATDWKKWSK